MQTVAAHYGSRSLNPRFRVSEKAPAQLGVAEAFVLEAISETQNVKLEMSKCDTEFCIALT